MSLLKLSQPIKFEPLAKFSKKTKQFVEDDWHHATLTYIQFVPSYDTRYNDLDYTDHEILEIIVKYGVRTPKYMSFNNKLTDDEYYKFALDNVTNKKFVRQDDDDDDNN